MHRFSGSFAGRSLKTSWRRCYGSSGFSLFQFCFFVSFQTDWMMMRSDLSGFSQTPCANKSHWIITINGKKLILEQLKNLNIVKNIHIHCQLEMKSNT